jgi:hypothetical protein
MPSGLKATLVTSFDDGERHADDPPVSLHRRTVPSMLPDTM